MAGIVVRMSWEDLFSDRVLEIYQAVSYRNLNSFFKGARKARKQLLKERGYYA